MGDDITNSEVVEFYKLMAKAIRDEEHLLIVNALEVVAWETSNPKKKLVVMYRLDEIFRGNSIPEVFRSLPDLFDDFSVTRSKKHLAQGPWRQFWIG